MHEQVERFLNYKGAIRRCSEQTLYNYEKVMTPFADFCESWSVSDPEFISNRLTEAYILRLTKRGMKPQSVNGHMRIVYDFIRWWRGMGGEIPDFKYSLVSYQKPTPIHRVHFTREEIAEVLSLATLKEDMVIRVMFDTGMRLFEMAKLRWSDIDGQRITVVGKGGKVADVYISELTLESLLLYKHVYGDSKYVLPAMRDDNKTPHISHEALRSLIQQAFARVGYYNAYPHAIRHSFATEIMRNGAPIEVAKEMLRHSSVVTSERYIHYFEDKNREYFGQFCGKLGA